MRLPSVPGRPAPYRVGTVDTPALTVVDPSSDGARWAMARYFAELAARVPGGFDPGEAIEDAASAYAPPRGTFVVAAVDGEIVGCGALQHLDTATSEVKRMWVSPGTRGLGVGRRLLAFLEDAARAGGRRRVVLDTNASLTEAIALYRSNGYREVPAYNDNPYAQHWFEKDLAPGSR